MKVTFYETLDEDQLKYTVIVSQHNGKWVFCKHKNRDTLECPGGKKETNESIEQCAIRELKEETGAIAFDMIPICIYGVTKDINSNPIEEDFGKVYYANIFSFEDLHSEIESIHFLDHLQINWTYPLIQPLLVERVQIHLLLNKFYQLISFTDIKHFNIEPFARLFFPDAIINDAQHTISIQKYKEDFMYNILHYPQIFNEGFMETQLSYTYEKKKDCILVSSKYKKIYNKNIEYGINHICFKQSESHYLIHSISYEEEA